MTDVVTIVGAGMAGAACAGALRAAGVPVRVLERGRAPGGRMAAPRLHGRRVDLGAGYFTVRDDGFRAVVERWQAAGSARPWTDTFAVLTPGQPATSTTGPMRWASPGGLRSLVRDLLEDIEVITGQATESLPDGRVVLAMPDPQAARLVERLDALDYDPVITVVCGFAERDWAPFDAAFVHDHPRIEFVADDGARRGDAAPVLVAHTTAQFAQVHLDRPEAAVPALVEALRELVGVGEPAWTHAHRWRFAKPAGRHGAAFGFANLPDGRRVGLAGDQWCPAGSPRVESAWRSGRDLGLAIAADIHG